MEDESDGSIEQRPRAIRLTSPHTARPHARVHRYAGSVDTRVWPTLEPPYLLITVRVRIRRADHFATPLPACTCPVDISLTFSRRPCTVEERGPATNCCDGQQPTFGRYEVRGHLCGLCLPLDLVARTRQGVPQPELLAQPAAEEIAPRDTRLCDFFRGKRTISLTTSEQPPRILRRRRTDF